MEDLMKRAILLLCIYFVSLFAPNYVPSPVVVIPNFTSYLSSFDAVCSLIFSSISLILFISIVVGVVNRTSVRNLCIGGPLFFAMMGFIVVITLSRFPIGGNGIRYGILIALIGLFILEIPLVLFGELVKYARVKLWKITTNTGVDMILYCVN